MAPQPRQAQAPIPKPPLPTAKFLPTAIPVAERLPDEGAAAPLEGDSRYQRFLRLSNGQQGPPLNEWIQLQSTFLYAVHFQPYSNDPNHAVVGRMQIEFTNGAICAWENVEGEHFFNLTRAPSKGKFHRSWGRYHGPCTLVRGATHTGAALAQRVAANESL